MIHPTDPIQIHGHLHAYLTVPVGDEKTDTADDEKPFLTYAEMRAEEQEKVDELEIENYEVTHTIAVQAVNKLSLREGIASDRMYSYRIEFDFYTCFYFIVQHDTGSSGST